MLLEGTWTVTDSDTGAVVTRQLDQISIDLTVHAAADATTIIEYTVDLGMISYPLLNELVHPDGFTVIQSILEAEL